jgi:hypothetical protein
MNTATTLLEFKANGATAPLELRRFAVSGIEVPLIKRIRGGARTMPTRAEWRGTVDVPTRKGGYVVRFKLNRTTWYDGCSPSQDAELPTPPCLVAELWRRGSYVGVLQGDGFAYIARPEIHRGE